MNLYAALTEVTDSIVELRRVEFVVERLLAPPRDARSLAMALALLALAKARADDAEIDLRRAVDAHTNERARRALSTEMVA